MPFAAAAVRRVAAGRWLHLWGRRHWQDERGTARGATRAQRDVRARLFGGEARRPRGTQGEAARQQRCRVEPCAVAVAVAIAVAVAASATSAVASANAAIGAAAIGTVGGVVAATEGAAGVRVQHVPVAGREAVEPRLVWQPRSRLAQ
eukprot:scaffold132263_cov60-Phaeocystis_antarctica.AAC.5